MCLTPERRTAWLKRLGKPETTPTAELSDDAIVDLAASTHDAREAETGPDGTITRGIEALSADKTRLETELAAARAQVLSLSADGGGGGAARAPDPEVLRDRADNYRDKVNNMVERGDMTRAVADKVLAAVAPAAGPSVLMLSADPSIGNRRPVDFVLSLFDGSKSGVAVNNGVARGAAVAPPPQFPTVGLSGDAAAGGGNGDDDPIAEARAYEARQLTSRGLAPAGK